nr:hypothetical protein BaRGS_029621 [Batillaria attramentaria]
MFGGHRGDILRAVSVMLEEHCEPFLRFQDTLVGKTGVLVKVLEASEPDVGAISEAAHCLSSKSRSKKTRKKKTAASGDEDQPSGETTKEGSEDKGDYKPGADLTSEFTAMSLQPSWARLTSSDSDFSDTEGGQTARGKLSVMQDLIQRCMEDPDPTVKLHGCKVLEELAQAILRDLQDTQNNPTPPPQALGLQDVGKQQECLRLILQLTLTEDRLVVSAAVRVLGVYVLYPCLSQNVAFIADVANSILKCMAVPSVNVKIKAAWALGNLCDALVVNKDKGDMDFMDQFSDMLLSSMLTAATTATQDSDKVKCNAVRAVGNILRYLPSRSLGKSHTLEAVAASVKVVIKTMNSGPMKVRWNSCYAIANMFRNPLLLSGEAPWLSDVLTALCQVVKDCKNFKVRINAALALSIPAERRHYGDVRLYVKVWTSLVDALQTAEEITDFAEFRYRDSLTEQVCFAALHMVSLAESTDVTAMLPTLQASGAVFKSHVQRFLTQNTPAKASAMKAVQQHLTTLVTQDAADDLADGVKLLTEVCMLETDTVETGAAQPQPTAFRQIYD